MIRKLYTTVALNRRIKHRLGLVAVLPSWLHYDDFIIHSRHVDEIAGSQVLKLPNAPILETASCSQLNVLYEALVHPVSIAYDID